VAKAAAEKEKEKGREEKVREPDVLPLKRLPRASLEQVQAVFLLSYDCHPSTSGEAQ
jgi:hypothetical protein